MNLFWINRLFVMGHRGPLRLSDLCKLYNESVHTLCSVFEHEWEKQQNYNERSDLEEDSGRESLLVSSKTNTGYILLYAIWVTFRPALVKVVLLRLSSDLFCILGPLTLRWVILFCERQALFSWAGYTYSLVVFGAVCCWAVSQHQFEKHSSIITANAQAVLAGALYRKMHRGLLSKQIHRALRLKPKPKSIIYYNLRFGFSSLGVFVLVDDGNVLTPPQIFTSLCFFRLLRPVLLELSDFLCALKQAQQSLCHLEKLFLTKDLLVTTKAVIVCYAAYSLTCTSLWASHKLHSKLLSDVLHMPVHFQKTNTTRLLQAFTRDMQMVDEKLPKHLHSWLRSLLDILSTITLISFIRPAFSLAVCPLIILFLHIQPAVKSDTWRQTLMFQLLLWSVRQCVEAPLSGPKHRKVCLTHCLQAFNQNLLVKYNKINTESWVALSLDAIAGIVLFLISLILLLSKPDSGLVALALICAFNIKEALHRHPQAASDINMDMLSMQNLCGFAKVEKEAAWSVTYRPPYDWPQHGEVKFRSFESEASSNCTLALRGINLTILKGEKIGVISREKTGTGGLVSCLFRSVEARSGAVLIDDVNIARMGLHDLRSRLQIISQVPVLFSGPLRTNLDPLSQYTDAQMWLALELCHLKERVRLLPAQLLHPVQRTSLAFSFGQRRLLCLARALLARVRILRVEEALPCVDLESEDLVQQLIHTEFKDCTVLWLTQNPLTVMQTDRVLVLNKGQAVNFDAPSTLLQQEPLFSQ